MGRPRLPRATDENENSTAPNETNHLILDESVVSSGPAAAAVENDPEPTTKASAAKRKRLERFIEKKLKKEERVTLIKSLAQSSVDLNVLRSSKNLGQGQETFKQQLKNALLEEKVGLKPSSSSTVPLFVPVSPPPLQPLPVFASALKKKSIGGAPAPPPSSKVAIDDHPPPMPAIKKQKTTEKLKTSDESSSSGVNQGKVDDMPVHLQSSSVPTARSQPDEKQPAESPAYYQSVNRTEAVRVARAQLPAVAEEYSIMESVNDNDIIIVCGETGSGKTTQIPQFLYEAGYGHSTGPHPGIIGITQPRRVAAVTMAKRVAFELNTTEKVVSHQVRYDGTVSATTAIKFMTDGILLKEISTDFLLRKYSCIIVDEAHERSVNTDILIGLLSRIIPLRNQLAKTDKELHPIKLIIMSATLRVQDFTENSQLFTAPPPILEITSRQFPVSVHFSKKTTGDYMNEAFKKVCKIHATLPAGGILVFVTGQNEVVSLCKKLRARFGSEKQRSDMEKGSVQASIPSTKSIVDKEEFDELMGESVDYAEFPSDEDESDDDDSFDELCDGAENMPLHVLPLYALLPTHEQMRVFAEVPHGSRLCVVATNVAETSLTIPNIKYVIDTGRVKERHFDFSRNVSFYKINWVSQASANQRMGRAGRTGPGHCYRLYSSAVFSNVMEQFSTPEIHRMPIESIVLLMKSMNIDHVLNFPFPSLPMRDQLKHAELLLVRLGALDPVTKNITDVGSIMAHFPVNPRFAKMLHGSIGKDILPYAVIIVAALSVGDPFLRTAADDGKFSEETFRLRQNFRKGIASDVIPWISAYGAYEFSGKTREFCEKTGLRTNAMKEIDQLRTQLINIISTIFPEMDCSALLRLKPLDGKAVRKLQKVLLSGFIDQIATHDSKGVYHPLVSGSTNGCASVDLHLHSQSCFSGSSTPKLVIYHEVEAGEFKSYMKHVTEVSDASWLGDACDVLCKYSKPLEVPAPRYESMVDSIICAVIPKYGDYDFELPVKKIAFPFGVDYCRHFAKELLDGNILAGFKKFSQHLLCKPNLLVSRKIPITHSRILSLVQPLMDRKIKSREDLMNAWQQDPQFLLNGVLSWISADMHAQVKADWPVKK